MATRYKDYSPTSFDYQGLNGDSLGISEWFVLPVVLTRDSESLEISNFETTKKLLADRFGGDFYDIDDNEITETLDEYVISDKTKYSLHRFDHWACGWFEILLIQNTKKGEEFANELEKTLENYCILDEYDYSERENEAASDYFHVQAHDFYFEICNTACHLKHWDNLISKITDDDMWNALEDVEKCIVHDGYVFECDCVKLIMSYIFKNRHDILRRKS